MRDEVLARWRPETNVDVGSVGKLIPDDPPALHVEALANRIRPRGVRASAGLELNVKPDDGSVVIRRAADMVDGVTESPTLN